MHPAHALRLTAARRWLFLTIIYMLILGSTSCGSAPTPTPTPTAPPTSTPEPTAMVTPTVTETSTPTATPDRTATTAVRATETTAARLEELAPELEKVGYGTTSGKLIYDSNAPKTMMVTEYNVFWPQMVVSKPVKDFILHVDVRWDSTSGLAGCGIIFRAEEDLERGAYYRMDIMRLQAAPVWGMYYVNYNTIQRNLVSDRFDKIINDEPDSVNNVMLVVKADQIQPYINDKKMIMGSYSKLSEGGIAFLTWQESGFTSCVFKNIWIWELNPDAPYPES